MAGGKFSKPRTPKREEREIDLAFRQVTGQSAPIKPSKPASAPKTTAQIKTEEKGNPTISRNRKITAIALCALALVLLIGVIVGVVILVSADSDDGLILNNVTVVGVNIGGMTPKEAAEALHRVTDLTYTQEDMVVSLPDGEIRLSPKDTAASLDIDALVQAAYDYGRSGSDDQNKQAYAQSLVSAHTIAALPYLQLDKDYIRQTLEDYFADFDSSYTDSSYTLEGEKPALDGKEFDKSAACQVLVLYTGTPGKYVDIEKIYNDILDAYSFNTFHVEASYGQEGTEPEALDLDAIFEELHSDPVDAQMNMETFEVKPELYGYTFDLEKAKAMLKLTQFGEELRINMEYITPEVLGKDLEAVLFRDVLGSFETAYGSDADRTANLKLACKALNGLVIDPGETFSFNETLGMCSGSDGYRNALCGEEDDQTLLGGGICQVASTLYYCAMVGDLRIVERHAHTYDPGFIDMGMDATVDGGSKDFRFLNNTTYPIRIEAEISGGFVKVKIMGTDEKDYFIRMDYSVEDYSKPKTVYEEYEEGNPEGYEDGDVIREGANGNTVNTYQCRYSKDTGTLISRDFVETTVYSALDRVVAKVIPKPTEPSEEPTEVTEATDVTEATEASEETEPSKVSEDPTEETA